MVPADSPVTLVVSKGPMIKLIKVQSFVGMPLEEAIVAAQSLGIEFGIVDREMNWNYIEGIIIRQDPTGDSEVKEGTAVNIVVSSGPGPQ